MEYLLLTVSDWFPEDAGDWFQSLSVWHIFILAAFVFALLALANLLSR